jgi:hypothetical protein
MSYLRNHLHTRMRMNEFPWGVVIILGAGLTFTAWIIYYILRLANEEMKDASK